MSTQTPEESRSNGRWSKEEHEKFMLGRFALTKVCSSMERIGKKLRHL